jgi:hypothetical protein
MGLTTTVSSKSPNLSPIGREEDSATEYLNQINRETLENERSTYERREIHKGVIHCFKSSPYRIKLTFAKQSNLETYIETNPKPPRSFKVKWILSLTDTLSYIYSRKVLVDEIGLRNFLIAD